MSLNTYPVCEVCRNSSNFKFKVLECGHQFCTSCCEKLANTAVTTGKLFVNSATAQVTTECPKCRSVTAGPIEALKTHIIGNIVCCQCDTQKLTKEIRWCHICNISVCSACYIDKHINTDGIGFHEASDWDSYRGVKAAIGWLKKMSLEHKQITDMCKTDVAKYLAGLQIYLAQRIDAAGNENQGVYTSTGNEIAQAYGISTDEIQATVPVPDSQFNYILSDAKKVAHISNTTAILAEIRFQQFSYEQLETTFLKTNVVSSKPSKYNRLSNLQSTLINTEYTGLDKISNPLDLAVLSSTEAIVLNSAGPYQYCASVCELIPVLTEKSLSKLSSPGSLEDFELDDTWQSPSQRRAKARNKSQVSASASKLTIEDIHAPTIPVYGRVLLIPHDRAKAMVTGSFGGIFKYIILVETEDKFKQWEDADGTLSWPLPNTDKVIASTDNVFTFSDNCLFVYKDDGKIEFCPLFKWSSRCAQFTELCCVQEEPNTTNFYLIGNTSRHLEIVQLDKTKHSLVSWRTVNLGLLNPDIVLEKPMMCVYGSDGFFLVWDRQATTIFTWNVTTNAFTLIADLHNKSLQGVHLCENYMYMMLRELDINHIERVKL